MILDVDLSEVSTRQIPGLTEFWSRVRIGKDAVSRIASSLIEEQRDRRGRSLVLQVVCADSIVMTDAVKGMGLLWSWREPPPLPSFEAYIGEVLAPTLRPGQIVVMYTSRPTMELSSGNLSKSRAARYCTCRPAKLRRALTP